MTMMSGVSRARSSANGSTSPTVGLSGTSLLATSVRLYSDARFGMPEHTPCGWGTGGGGLARGAAFGSISLDATLVLALASLLVGVGCWRRLLASAVGQLYW
jgi:hypothetical protein